MDYADVEIRIFKQDANGYRVEITVAGQGEPGSGHLTASVQPPTLSDNHYADAFYGQALFDWFFADPTLMKIWARLRGSHRLRRIRLRIDADEAVLHAVAWEALCEPPDNQGVVLPLAADSATPFSRYWAVDLPLGAPIARRPIRILVVAPDQVDFKEEYLARNPGMAAINPQDEFVALQRALQPAIDRQQVELVLLDPPCSLARISQALRDGYHGLHLVCHGQFDKHTGCAALLLADAENRVVRETDESIAAMLGQQLVDAGEQNGAQLRLVFLASCQSANRSSSDAFRGLAPRLLEAGVPAVVAMQGRVGDVTAREFALRFYEGLLRHGRVDLASNEARQSLLAARLPGPVIPVLFLRMKDGQLLRPDPDWTALRDALRRMREDETYADVADGSGKFLRMPVELAPLDKDRSYEHPLLARGASIAGVLFAYAVRDKCQDPASGLILVTGYYGSNLTTQLKRFAWMEIGDALRRLDSMIAPEPSPPVDVALNIQSGIERLDSMIAPELSPPGHGQKPAFLPLFASLGALRDGKSRYPADPTLGLVLHELNNRRRPDPFWPDLTAARLVNLLEKADLRLLLILDDDDTLSEREARDFHAKVVEFVAKPANSNHKVVLAVRPPSLTPGGPFSKHECSVLGVQRMERRKVRHFLQVEAQEHQWAHDLLEQIDQSAYFDLVAVPWFLYKVVDQAKHGFCPRSRTEVITAIVDDAIDDVVRDISGSEPGQQRSGPSTQGLEENVRQVVYELAWHMQSNYADTMPLADTLAAIERQRGLRHYSAESMYHALVRKRLLAPKGSDGVRFAYQGIRGYCCAKAILRQPSSDSVLEHVMAGVGRLTRLRWWEDTLVFACGLMASSPSELNRFLKVVVYGMDPQDNEQVFLAARCVGESTHTSLAMAQEGEQATQSELQGLAEVIATALIWRLDSRSEPRSAERRRAAELLGQTTNPPRVRELVQVAYRESRWDRHRLKALEHSDVRMAAVAGLFRLTGEQRLDLLRELDKRGVLEAMLKEWNDGSVQELAGRVREGANVAAQGIAALALGDLYGRLVLSASPDDKKMASHALNELTAQFHDLATHDDTMWALTYALAMIDLPTVKRAMVERCLWEGVGQEKRVSPLPDEIVYASSTDAGADSQEGRMAPSPDKRVKAFFQEWSQRGAKQKFLTYLIGQMQWREPPALDFLHEQCLRQNHSDCTLAAVAIDALSQVGSSTCDVPLLEDIALGKWQGVLGLEKVSSNNREYLQRKAIESLASLGDLSCVDRLREGARTAKWTPNLEKALFLTSEKIFWRLRWAREQ